MTDGKIIRETDIALPNSESAQLRVFEVTFPS